MAEYLLVAEGQLENGMDLAMMVDETTYLAALFGHVFDAGVVVSGFVWCARHGWASSDETGICDDCVDEHVCACDA